MSAFGLTGPRLTKACLRDVNKVPNFSYLGSLYGWYHRWQSPPSPHPQK